MVNPLLAMYMLSLYRLSETHPHVTTWATLVRDMLNNCGFGNFWADQYVENEVKFMSMLKQRLYDIYKQDWCGEIGQTSDHRLYKHIKDAFCYEKYLNVCPLNLRIPLTKLRLSSHCFNVERGRWGKIDFNERKCRLCDTVEDEYHCIVECPLYTSVRKGHLPDMLRDKPNMSKFVQFFKSTEIVDCVDLSILCKRIMSEHKKYL